MYGMIRYFDEGKDVNRIEVRPTLEQSDRAVSGHITAWLVLLIR